MAEKEMAEKETESGLEIEDLGAVLGYLALVIGFGVWVKTEV